MRFTTPLALILLLLVPYFIWVGRPHKSTARWRDWASLGLRLLIILLLILGLAGTQVVRASDELAIVFLVDASDSIGTEQAGVAEDFVRQAMKSMGQSDRAAVVVFGANALVERQMSALAELAPITSIPKSLHTDIGEAIRLGLALFPAGSARRLVLLSDGAATQGNTLEAVKLATSAGVEMDVVPLSRGPVDVEALLTHVEAPSRVGEGETFRINITAESTSNVPAELRILAGGLVVHSESIQLRPGINNFTVPLRATNQEFARYVVQLTPQWDTYYENNQLAAYTDIVGPPTILLVAEAGSIDEQGALKPDEGNELRSALEATGLVVKRATPATLPSNLAQLSSYDSVLLANVNAKGLSPRKMEALQSYVRDLGGGLVVSGGPESYGMGGYFRTPLEKVLPVDMQIEDQERFPSVSIVIVMDRSGSMAVREGGATKIQLAAEGAVRVVELLNDLDEITVIPVDTEPDQTIGPVAAVDRVEITGRIRQIGAGGGGIFVRTGLEAAAEALAQSSNQVKHIILLADGADSEQKEGVPAVIEALAAEGVTVSTVSIGAGPDVSWLQEMAKLGGGRFHFTDRAANIPQIFTQETTTIQRSYLIEERFFPTLGESNFARRHAIFRAMENADITRVPPLFGYVGTSPKATAQIILETQLGDPLLAAWEHGLGRAVAWTSDATGRWATEWVPWPGFPTFWSNLIRWSIQEGKGSTLESAVIFEEEEARLVVDARDDDGRYINDLDLEATVVSPKGETTNLQLRQIAPGQYEGEFTPTHEGAYLLRVSGASSDGAIVAGQTSGWVLGYSPEYRQLEANPLLLNQIVDIAGGRMLDPGIEDDASAVFERNLPGTETTRPIWPWLVGMAALLLPVDIAVRRLAITRRDAERIWDTTFGRLQPRTAPDTGRREQVARLFQAKRRATEAHTVDPASEKPTPTRQENMVDVTADERISSSDMPTTTAKPDSAHDEKSLASHLLANKRRREANNGENDEHQR